MSKSVIATKISLALGLVLAMLFGSAPVGAFAAVVRTTYIVQVQDGYANEVRASIGRLGETPHDELTEVMDGFVIDLTETEVAALRLAPYVKQVVADAPMQLMDTQSPVPSWGLDRIDQKTTTGDGAYNYPANGGAGVRVYVVDTGVMASNPDFAGRILPGVDMMGQNLEAADCQGHGTHVAGTIAGTKYGVAKKAWIVPVRVLSCSGSGSWSYFISAMDWIIANNPAGTPAVMSASIGGGSYSLANTAVEKLYAAGITPVIAAGNSNADACGTSPAGAPNAITVGATDIKDVRASYSNWGECVDVFAPGSLIVSDSYTDPTGSRTLSGTSMATPHVSGLAALYLASHPTATPAEVTAAIEAGGLTGAVTNAQSTLGNILINNTFTRASVPVTPAPVYPPTGLTATGITSTGATVSWTAPAVSTTATAPTGYKVEYKVTTASAWTAINTAATSVNLTGLSTLSNYVVRVTSIAGADLSDPSPELQFSTLGTAPDAPTNLISTAIYGSQIDLAWTAPNSNGGSITGYYLEQNISGNWTRIATPYGKSWSVTRLTPSTVYSFRIQAYNTFGPGLYSNVLTLSTTAATPATPTGINFPSIGGNTATVAWTASPQLVTSTPITYTVRLYSRSTINFGAVLGTYTATTNSYTITGLKRTTSYSVSVTAVSGTAVSPTSGLAVFTTTSSKPGAPSSTKAVKTATGFTLSWAYPADDGGSPITGYQLDKQNADGTWTGFDVLARTTLSYDAPAPARATVVNYRVAAINSYGVGTYAAITISTPAGLPEAPQNLTITRGTSTSLLAWSAPTDNGGSPITSYTLWRSADNGLTWVSLTSVNSTTLTIGLPAKGAKYLYAVAARNVSGVGAKSNTVSDERVATVPAAVRGISFSYPVVNKLQIVWGIPSDNGGSAITGYRVERQLADGSWSVISEANVTSMQIDRDLPGVMVVVRVTPVNAIGDGPTYSSSWRTPYVKATAPQNFTATDTGVSVATSWTAPTNLGGSALNSYQMQISKDGGVTWTGCCTVSATATSFTISRPTKGTTWSYRLLAYTGFGLGEPSNSVAISAALTAPGAPSMRSVGFAVDGSVNLAWYLSTDNGGSAITSVVVEKSSDNINWAQLVSLAGNATTANFARELPGVRVYFRVKTVNAIGTSNVSSPIMLFTPYLQASAPLNFTAVDNGSNVTVSWAAPTELGGSTVSQYQVTASRDGGVTWMTLAYPGASATSAVVNRPTKGQTWTYRIAARTGFGLSQTAISGAITAPLTVASAPSPRSLLLGADGNLTASWYLPGDNGGSPITGIIAETSSDNVNWRALPALAGNATSLVLASGGPGVKTYVRLTAVNATGNSKVSGSLYYQVPYAKASAPEALAASLVSGRVQLTWTASASTGGSAVTQYVIEYTPNGGANWYTAAYASGTATSISVPTPGKGQTFGYRVSARTLAGNGAASTVVSMTTATTVASAARLYSLTRTGAGTFNLTFGQPSDMGGFPSYNYRVEINNGGVWSSIASGTGGSTTMVSLTAPNTTTYYTYRVVVTNPAGESAGASFNYRG